MPGGKRLAPLADSVFKVLRQTHSDATPKAHAMAAVLELLARALDKVTAAAAAAAVEFSSYSVRQRTGWYAAPTHRGPAAAIVGGIGGSNESIIASLSLWLP